ncbi:MAG: hypothetical protein GEU77_19745 [Deltaproteobacteria bacterium]|nr:hypothetical protein [Deltaproteobacteria bacterium]
MTLFLEESARLQTEAMKLGTPMFMERDEAEKIAKRLSSLPPSNALGTILRQNTPIDFDAPPFGPTSA